ncbi:hypothetical protein JAAARDRAFT_163805 [Jaapia argillacea MUCL 33604]|uniref:FAD-binding PCMH-type domain-containing protein n=1 Tax=Jaapia argillacea MUCL 33604 TaxID=933084 RepID=A0A067PJJ4_9AGAM|nr:hypothetical protein JAAARDRAFT_163805 [Jaapia argillacea MUCL 33604]
MGSLFSRLLPHRAKRVSTAPGPTTPPPPRTPAETQSEFVTALSHAGIKGGIKTPGHIDYDIDTIPWNLRCAPKPVAVLYASNPKDVQLAVQVAAKFGIPIQPRSGGHSFASYSLGGRSGALVIDLAALNDVHVDQKTWRATIGGGTRLDKVTKELFAQGKRTIAHGTCPQVGIGGHATIGGQGPLSRMYGLCLDHVVEVEVVVADGSIVRANGSKNSDLFWALLGAAASFGIITSFVFETHPAPTTVTHYSFQLTIGSPSELAAAFMAWQSFVSSPVVVNDRQFNSIVNILKGGILVQGTRFGTQAELEASDAHIEMCKLFKVDVDIKQLDWLASILFWATNEVYTISGGVSIPAYMKSFVVRQSTPLPITAVESWFKYMNRHHAPPDSTFVIVADLQGGRTSDFANDATAYAHRDALYTVCIYGLATLPFPDDVLAFLSGMVDSVADATPDITYGVYPGYVDPLIPKSKWPTQYWGSNYPRLLQIKNKYDPKHVFANPQSVGSESDFAGTAPLSP